MNLGRIGACFDDRLRGELVRRPRFLSQLSARAGIAQSVEHHGTAPASRNRQHTRVMSLDFIEFASSSSSKSEVRGGPPDGSSNLRIQNHPKSTPAQESTIGRPQVATSRPAA